MSILTHLPPFLLGHHGNRVQPTPEFAEHFLDLKTAEARGGWGNVEIATQQAHHLVGNMAIQAATLFAHHDPRSANWSLTVRPLKVFRVPFPKGKDHLLTMMVKEWWNSKTNYYDSMVASWTNPGFPPRCFGGDFSTSDHWLKIQVHPPIGGNMKMSTCFQLSNMQFYWDRVVQSTACVRKRLLFFWSTHLLNKLKHEHGSTVQSVSTLVLDILFM